MKGIFFLICQYLRPQKSIISLMTYLSILGPLIGVCVLVVITSVMNGFPIALQKKIIEFESDVSIRSKYDQKIKKPYELIKKLKKNGIAASPVTSFYSFIYKNETIILFQTKGILPRYDKNVSALKKYVKNDHYDIKSGECLIGSNLASKHNLKIGDKIILHSPEKYASLINFTKNHKNDSPLIETNQTLELVIIDIFSYGYSSVDNNFIYVHLDDANDMTNINWDEAKEIETAVKNPFDAINLANNLAKQKDFDSYNFTPWQYKHKDYYETVQREKALITFTLFFIMAGAAIGIAATLFSLIIQKTKEIGILKTLGVSKLSIIILFLFQGTFIGLIGVFLGLGLGLVILKFRNDIFKFLWNSQAYFLDNIPALIIPVEIFKIMLTACIICVIGALIPAIFASLIKPVYALKLDR